MPHPFTEPLSASDAGLRRCGDVRSTVPRRKAAGAFIGLVLVLVQGAAGCGSPLSSQGGGGVTLPSPVADQSIPQTPPPPTGEPALPPSVAGAGTAPANVDAAAAGPAGAPTQVGRLLVARVNDQPIFADIYQRQIEQTEKALAEQGMLAAGAAGDEQRAQVRMNVLQGLIDQALIEQAAARMGITVSDEELEQSLQSIAAQGQGSLDQWLVTNQMTMDELRAMQRAQLVAGKVIATVSASVPTVAEQTHARHIFTADQSKAQTLIQRLRDGGSPLVSQGGGGTFAAVAQQESEDASTAANGGDLGWFPKDAPMMPPPVVQAAFALQVGEVSDPVQSDLGYHIVKVEAREANRPLSSELLLYAQQRAFETWLAEQRAQAKIERSQAL